MAATRVTKLGDYKLLQPGARLHGPDKYKNDIHPRVHQLDDLWALVNKEFDNLAAGIGTVFAGAGVPGIVPDPITESGRVLSDNASWVTRLANIVEDLTPQLGANLDVNGKSIVDGAGTAQVDISGNAWFVTTDNGGFGSTYLLANVSKFELAGPGSSGVVGDASSLRFNHATSVRITTAPVTIDNLNGGGTDVVLANATGLLSKASASSLGYLDNIYTTNGTTGAGRAVSLTDTLAFDTDLLFLNSSISRIGIKTSSPSAPVHIVGPVGNNLPVISAIPTVLIVDNGVTAAGPSISLIGDTDAGTTNLYFGDETTQIVFEHEHSYVTSTYTMEYIAPADNGISIASATNHIGINELTPQGQFHVVESVATAFTPSAGLTTAILEASADVGLGMYTNSGAQARIGFGSSANNFESGIQANLGSDTLQFFVAASSDGQITINSSGTAIGVGVASTHLHVIDTVGSLPGLGTDTSMIIQKNAGVSDSAGLLILSGTSGTGIIKFGDSGSATNGTIRFNHTLDKMFLDTTTPDGVVIDASGNVGMGTSTPSNHLDISRSLASSRHTAISVYNTSGTDVASEVAIQLGRGATFPMAAIVSSNENGGSFSHGFLAFEVRKSGSLAQAMYINQDGQVGIGTTTLTAKLNVVNTAGGSIYAEASAGQTALRTNTNSGGAAIKMAHSGTDKWNMELSGSGGANMHFEEISGGASRMTLEAGGNIGMGTTTPINALHISKAASGIVLENTTGTINERVIQMFTTSSSLFRLRGLTDAYGAGIDGINMNLNTGNVGLGTTAPAQPLEVFRSGVTSRVYVRTDTAHVASFMADANYAAADSPSGRFDMMWNSNVIARVEGRTGLDTVNKDEGFMRFMTADGGSLAEHMRITQTGLVGIGAFPPTQKLHIKQDQNAITAALIENTTAGATSSAGWYLQSSGTLSGTVSVTSSSYSPAHLASRMIVSTTGTTTGLDLQSTAGSGDMRFYTGGFGTANEHMRITSTGLVGIGNTTPTNKVDIFSTTNLIVRAQTSAVNGAATLRTQNDAQIWDMEVAGGDGDRWRLEDVTNGTVPIRVDPNTPTSTLFLAAGGYVGIGTGVPTNPLVISGAATFGTNSNIENLSTGGKAWQFKSSGSTSNGGAGNFWLRNATDSKTMIEVNGTNDNVVIGVNAFTANTSAILELRSTSKGLLVPRMTGAQVLAIGTPADGLIVYATSTSGAITAVGFWGRTAGAWRRLD